MAPLDTTRMTLLLRLRDRSDKLSWDEFHERYGDMLYRYARSRGAAHADAEDLVQEVEMYLFKALDGFEYDVRKGRFRGYLRASMVHAMGRKANKDARQGTSIDPNDFDYIAADDDASNDDLWTREWRFQRLRWAMTAVAGEIEPSTLQAFQLHVLANRPADEVAEETGLSKASVYQAKSRVLKRLRDWLHANDPEENL